MPADNEKLATSELFRDLPPEAVSRLLALGERSSPRSGATLFTLGEPADSLYVVEAGQITLTMPIELRGVSQEIPIDEKGPLDVIGWSALVPPHRATLSARVTVDSEVVAFKRDALLAAFKSDAATGLQLMTNLATVIGRRLHQTQAMWARELQRVVSARYA